MNDNFVKNWHRLERALRLYVSWSSNSQREPKSALLARNADVAEYLEPMLDSDDEPSSLIEPNPTRQRWRAKEKEPSNEPKKLRSAE